MGIAIVCKPGCDVMNFDVNLIFLIKLFSNDQKVVTKSKESKKSSQKLGYLEDEKSFWDEIKNIFYHF